MSRKNLMKLVTHFINNALIVNNNELEFIGNDFRISYEEIHYLEKFELHKFEELIPTDKFLHKNKMTFFY